MLPPSIPISQPVRSPKFGALPSPSTNHIHGKYDVLVWFEICELAPNGEYVPAAVEHSDDLPCRGLFLLHQGIQRRIRITIVHEQTPELRWKDVRELVVGEWFVFALLFLNLWPECDIVVTMFFQLFEVPQSHHERCLKNFFSSNLKEMVNLEDKEYWFTIGGSTNNHY